MGSGANRFLLLLTPSPLLPHRFPSLLRLSHRLSPSFTSFFHHHHHHLPTSPLLTTISSTATTAPCLLPAKSSRQLHTQVSSLPHASAPSIGHPLHELQALLDSLSASGYFHRADGDEEYVGGQDLTEDFVRAANACLSFARDRPTLLLMVSRRDVEVVVENGKPFLFRKGDESARRMKAFLGSNVFDTYEANTVDLMRFLLSYASNPSASSDAKNPYNKELFESSVRNLLGQLAKLSYNTPESNFSGTVQNQFSDRYGLTRRPFGQNIEMKRGDWICPRCSFMNFARNVKCLECEEARPKRQLTGGEWECPQCDFFNYGRNMVCLRCDCKRPGKVSHRTANNMSGQGYGYGGFGNKADMESRLAANEEKAQRWFSKVSQLDSTSYMSSAIADEDFPEIMPLRKGVNRFVVSTRKIPLERRLANAQYQRNLDNDSSGTDLQTADERKASGTKLSQKLDDILGHSSSSESYKSGATADKNTGVDSSPAISSSGSSQYGNFRGSNSNYVPFVPLPEDMFAKKPESAKTDENVHAMLDNYHSDASNTNEKTGAFSGRNDYNNAKDNLQPSEKPVNLTEITDKENEQAEKSERWFNIVTELDNVTDLASSTSDEDLPEIMPMRKGENRFVVNKKKDRSLTSPMYKRRVAMEHSNNTNFVPFVPFPPDYFAKDKQQKEGADSTLKASGETSNSVVPGKLDEARAALADVNGMRPIESQQSQNRSSKPEISTSAAYGTSTNDNSAQKFINPLHTNNDNWSSVDSKQDETKLAGTSSLPTENQNTGYSGKEMQNLSGSSSQRTENQSIRSSWTGKTLEGSAVKEPDPLDMSEEAKAERWFRRVSQIKDISELSQIPDEDFPSIMPLRKGVNRFVVSKRKTPLERRLTSQQYRRSLPIISSDPIKKESDSS